MQDPVAELVHPSHRVTAPPRPTSWADLERALVFRLASGSYAPGDRLPTCQQTAADFGVNKNTVNKAYRALAARGYVRSVRGQGTIVVRRPARPDAPPALADVENLLSLLLQEAKLAGLSHAQFLELVHAAAGQAYQRARVRLGFVECNAYEASAVSRDLQQALAHPLEPLLLHEVRAAPDRVRQQFDMLVVSLPHLQELEESLGVDGQSTGPEIVGLLLSPDPAVLTEVARMRRGTRVGVVCDVAESAQKLTSMLAAYNRGIQVTSCVSDQDRDLRRLLSSVDVVVAGFVATDRVQSYHPEVPVIRVTWNRLEERSVREVARRLEDMGRACQPSDTLVPAVP